MFRKSYEADYETTSTVIFLLIDLWDYMGTRWSVFPLSFQIRAISGANAQRNPLFFLAAYAPMISALILVVVTRGIPGLGAYLRRLLHWRLNVLWYVLIL